MDEQITINYGNTVQCPGCNGTKKVASLGFMQTDCTACGAVGYVTRSLKPLAIHTPPSLIDIKINNAIEHKQRKYINKAKKLEALRKRQARYAMRTNVLRERGLDGK